MMTSEEALHYVSNHITQTMPELEVVKSVVEHQIPIGAGQEHKGLRFTWVVKSGDFEKYVTAGVDDTTPSLKNEVVSSIATKVTHSIRRDFDEFKKKG